MNTILVKCTGAELIDFHNLIEFQGNLKIRSIEQLDKLKKTIITDGFLYPFFIWRNDEFNYIIDGHGRLQALLNLEADGYGIPLLPAVYVLANDEHDAKLKLLKCISRYGDITEASYQYFTDGIRIEDLSDIEIQFDKVEILKVDTDKHLEEVRNMLELPTIDMPMTNIMITCPYCMKDSSFTISEVKKAINAVLS